MAAQRSEGKPDQTLVELSFETAGRYVLKDLIGKGATGEVWRADDPEIGRSVAVKLLQIPGGLPADERAEWENRFFQEARAAGRLSHPHAVPVFDVGRSTHGRPYMVMELVQGRSLDAVMKDGVPQPAFSLQWCAQVAEALEAAHRHGIVHRDIKPANIVIGPDQRARVLDFGIARMAKSDLTRTGLFLGSPAYASPEQLQSLAVDGRSDIFSLGATLYALLSGVRPFQGDDLPTLVYSICHRNPAPLARLAPGLPPETEATVMKALAKDPARRYKNGEEFSLALRALLEKTPRPASGRAESSDALRQIVTALSRMAAAAAAALHRAGAWSLKEWRRGWAKGPRARYAMVGGAAIVLAVVIWGGLMIHEKLDRQTPGERFKKAFTSLFSRR